MGFASVGELLAKAHAIAVVGLSPKPERESHGVAAYLQHAGYRIAPVNPTLPPNSLILGEPVFPTLTAIPFPVDVVVVFRKSGDVPPVAAAALKMKPLPKAFWMQLGIENEGAARELRAAGVFVVQNQCLRTEHQKQRGAERALQDTRESGPAPDRTGSLPGVSGASWPFDYGPVNGNGADEGERKEGAGKDLNGG